MGKIFFIMGKSSTGKDTIYQRLLSEKNLSLSPVILYTTRPRRHTETDGVEYHFVDTEKMNQIKAAGHIIEMRSYQTIAGIWNYFTVDDGSVCLGDNRYLMIGTLESYRKIREYYGRENVVPIYIEVEDGERLERALRREKKQKKPAYAEVCRRYLADEADFTKQKLQQCGIERVYQNVELEACIEEICNMIKNS